MKVLVFSAVFLTGTACAQPVQKGINWLLDHYATMSREELKGAEYESALGEMKEQLRRGPKLISYRSVLIHAGDQEVVAQCLTNFKRTDEKSSGIAERATEALTGARVPSLIPLVAEQMFRDESATPSFDGVTFRYPLSARAAQVTWITLERCSEFPSDTREWSMKLGETLGRAAYDKRREQMRLWWRANEKWIKAGEYGKARPITMDGRIIREDGTVEPLPQMQPASSATPSSVGPNPLASTSVPAARASRHSIALYSVAVVLAAAVAVGCWKFLRRR